MRVIEPAADFLVRRRVNPNVITTVGTVCTLTGAVVYATGHIMTAGWIIALTALFDVLDGTVARRTGQSSVFGAFYDSTLDRVADGGVLAGLAVFYASSVIYHNIYMLVVCLLGIIGTFLVSYTRARAAALGIDAKVGVMQRPGARGVIIRTTGLFRPGAAWLGPHGDRRPAHSYGMDNGRSAHQLRPSRNVQETTGECLTAPLHPKSRRLQVSSVFSRPALAPWPRRSSQESRVSAAGWRSRSAR